MPIDHMHRIIRSDVGILGRNLPTIAEHEAFRGARAEAPSAPVTRADLDDMTDRLMRHVDAVGSRTETRVVAKLEEKDRLAMQRFQDARGSWSKFILHTCFKAFGTVFMRYLPTIIGMTSVDIAAGAALGGPVGLGVAVGVLLLAAAVLIGWQAYQAYKEYRMLKAASLEAEQNAVAGPELHEANPEADEAGPEADRTRPRIEAADDAAPIGPTKPVAAPPTPPAPSSPRLASAPTSPPSGWRHHCADFTRFVMHRGIR